MPTLQELQEKRAKLATEIRTRADAYTKNNKVWKDDAERQAWTKVNADYDANMKEMDKARAEAEVEARMKKLQEDEERSSNPANKPGMDDTDPPDGSDDFSNEWEARSNRTERRSQRRDVPKPPDEETRCLALAGWMRSQQDMELRPQHMVAMRSCGYTPWMRGMDIAAPSRTWMKRMQNEFRNGHHSAAVARCLESRALSDITFASGGALVPTSFIRALEVNMLAFGGMLQVASIFTTGSGGTMTIPTANDTGNTGTRLGENTTIGDSTDPIFGGVQWGDHKYSSKPVLVPNELLEDSFYDLPSFLAEALAERIARKQNTDFTVGSGANEPKGIVTASTNGRTSGSANAISYDDVVYLEHSIDPAYRPGCEFMSHDNVVLALRLLKDSQNRPLWTYGVDVGQPDRLNGKRLTINQDMDSAITTGKKALLYGRLDKYIIRRVGSSRFYRLQERYRDTDQDGFICFQRADGNLLTAGTGNCKYITVQ